MSRLQKMVDGLPVSSPWEHPHATRLDSISFGEWLASKRALTDTRRFMSMVSLVHWGAPVGDVSLFNVMRYIKNLGGIEHMLAVEGGNQQDRVLGTAHTMVGRLADTLGSRVLLASPVERITTVGNRATVETAQETIAARYVIVTASPTHRSTIKFTPALPEQHYGLSRSWRLGALSKAFVAYDRPFWRSRGLSGEAVSDDETVFLTFDVSPPQTAPAYSWCSATPAGLTPTTRTNAAAASSTTSPIFTESPRSMLSTTPISRGATTYWRLAGPTQHSGRKHGRLLENSCGSRSVSCTGPAPRQPTRRQAP
ncbi:FAD-dependent oxidoreductase [Couchioplanes caeruleus]|nr:FAD-dependent oxidoreductase [Couchioplanes caeruleus]UQU62212.1 FAD-dependent oxidoreductase [Couchioplanes caeruleus]